MGIAKILSKIEPMSVLTLDNIPPFYLPMPIKPELIEDDWSAEFGYAKSPGSRYQYPIFNGCTPRVIRFTAKYDANFSSFTSGKGAQVGVCNKDTSKHDNSTFSGGYKYTQDMQSIHSILEILKLPKQGIAGALSDTIGVFTKVQQGTSSPAPPLCLLCINVTKIMVGYFSNIKINVTKRVKHMFPSRFEAECEFLVTPDYIFTNLEDTVRFTNALISYRHLGKAINSAKDYVKGVL